jgi:hypothetical protein
LAELTDLDPQAIQIAVIDGTLVDAWIAERRIILFEVLAGFLDDVRLGLA